MLTIEKFATCNVLGFAFAKMTLDETLTYLAARLQGDTPCHVITANPEIVMLARKNAKLGAILQQGDLLTADGTGIVWGAGCLGCPLPQRVTGVDLTEGLLDIAVKSGLRVALLGGKPEVAKQAAQNMQTKFPGLKIPVIHHGYLKGIDPSEPARQMAQAEVDIVLVGMGAPLQEEWIDQFKLQTGAKVLIGIGGVLDLWSGVAKRAPGFCCRCGMEWAWRICKEPSRLPRAMAIPQFIWAIKKTKFCRSD